MTLGIGMVGIGQQAIKKQVGIDQPKKKAAAKKATPSGPMQGPIRKTFTDSKGVLRYRGTGEKVPAKIAEELRRRAALKKKPAAKKKATKRRAGSSSSSSSTAASVPDLTTGATDLGNFGSPNMTNVSRIVDSIINDATSEFRWANEDARRQTLSDLQSVAGGTLALDGLSQAQAAANKHYTDQMLTRSTDSANAERSFVESMRQNLEQNTQTGSVPMEYAAQDAGMAGDLAAQDTGLSQTGAANQSFFDMSRLAHAAQAQESGRNIRSAYGQTKAQNDRAIAAERAKRALYQQQIEKDLWDQHIAKQMARAEFAQRGSNLQNDAVNRNAAQLDAAGKADQQALQKRALDAEQYQVVSSILWGTGEKVKVPAGVDKNGKPFYEEHIVPVGQASSLKEALQRLRAAGLSGSKWTQLATEAWREIANEKARRGNAQTLAGFNQQIMNSIGNTWGTQPAQ